MNSKVFCAVLGLCFLALATAGPVINDGAGHIDNSVHVNEHTSVEEALLKKLNTKCSNHDVSSCMMLKLVTYFNKLLKKSSIEIGDVEITQTSAEPIQQDTSRSMDVTNMSEDAQFTEVLSTKVWNFLRTRSLKWKITDDADLVIGGNAKDGSFNFGFSIKPAASDAGDARKKKGGGHGMGGMMALAALKMGLLKAIAFKALALLVGKALLVSKLALVLAAIIGLKKLFSQEKYVTYEVVAHPQHEHHHEHSFGGGGGGGHDSYGGGGGGGGGGHGGWGRTLDAGDLAYSAHKPS